MREFKKLNDHDRFKKQVYENSIEFNEVQDKKIAKRLEQLPETREEKIKLFNYRSEYILNAENLYPTQKYKKITLEEFFHYVFCRPDNLDFSNKNITKIPLPFETKIGDSIGVEGDYVYNGLVKERYYNSDGEKRHRPWVITKDLSELKNLKGKEFVVTSPITYVGRSRKSNNARMFYGFAIDLDYQTEEQVHYMIHWFHINHIPMPNIVVNSGGGAHLYYLLEKPIPLYSSNIESLNKLKQNLTQVVWNSHTSLSYKIQQQNIYQAYRVPESLTKFGVPVEAFVNTKSHYWKLEDLNTYKYDGDTVLLTDFEINQLNKSVTSKSSSSRLKQAKENWPEWYQRRIVEGKPPKYIQFNRGLYDWWTNKLWSMQEVRVGHRFFCCLAAVAYATKCNIPKEEVEKDLLEIVNTFESLTNDEDNHFTKEDVEDALKFYGSREAHRKTKDYIEKQTGLTMPKNKKNGYSKSLHIKRMIKTRELDYELGITTRPTRKGKSVQITLLKNYLKENETTTNKSKIARELGISRKTVQRNYDRIKNELASTRVVNENEDTSRRK